MFEALSQEEVDRLFGPKKTDTDEKDSQKGSEDGVQLSQAEIDLLVKSHKDGAGLGSKDSVKVQVQDFKRVNIATKNELNEFKSMAEEFCCNLSEYFSGKTNRSIIFEVADVVQTTRENFGFRIPKPTFFASTRAFDSPLLVQSDYSIVQRGILQRNVSPGAKILDFDNELYKFAVVKPILACLHTFINKKKKQKKLDFRLGTLEEPVCCKPENCTEIPLYEVGVIFSLRVKAADQEGMFNLFYSKGIVTSLIEKGIISKDVSQKNKKDRGDTDSVVVLGGCWSNVAETLKVGITLPIDKKSGDEVDLVRDNKVIAKGNVVVLDGDNLGFNVTKVMD